MKSYLKLLALSASVLACVPAYAQGPRLEAFAGIDRAKFGGLQSESGALVGIGGGYDVAIGKGLELGADIEFAESGAKFNGRSYIEGVWTNSRVSANRELYFGGRVTGQLTDMLSVYGKVGYSNARYTDVVTGRTNLTVSRSVDGVRFGGGLSMNLGKFSVGPEYRYASHGDDLRRHQLLFKIGYGF